MDALLEKGRVRKPPRYKIKRMWEALTDAARRHRKCLIRYHKKGVGEQEYFVAPYSFRTKPGGEVLYAFDFVDGHIKSFSRNRVTGVHVTERRFVPKWDVELSVEDSSVDTVLKSFGYLAQLVHKEESSLTMEDFFKQGLAAKKKVTRDDVDPEELRMGIVVEMEHTDDEKVAEKIALDHLAEFGKYYTALAAMEKKLKEEKKSTEKATTGAPPKASTSVVITKPRITKPTASKHP